VHQVGPKDSWSQNFSFKVLKAEPVGEVQILRTIATDIKVRNEKREITSSAKESNAERIHHCIQ
jgi:hypothetical protein